MTTKKIELNVWRNAHAVITAVQGETAARFLEISINNHEKPLNLTNKTVAIYMTKPDKKIIYNTCEIIDAQNGIIGIELTAQMSAVAGTIPDCEIHVTEKSGALLKILGLTLVIDRSLETDQAIESTNEFTRLQQALKEADGASEQILQILEEKWKENERQQEAWRTQMQANITEWLTEKDETLLHKLQSVDDWIESGESRLQQAENEANTAASRANAAVENIAQTAAEQVKATLEQQKNQANGIAGLNEKGKLIQMPTAHDVGGVPQQRKINGKPLTEDVTLTVSDIGEGAIFLTVHPVGSIFISTNATNPGTLYGGTWVSWGSGRMPVGVNTADSDFSSAEKTGGAKTHTLTVNELPSHWHKLHADYYYDVSNKNKTNVTNKDFADKTGGLKESRINMGTASTGGGQAHNNMPPYITCYMWKRTA